MPVGKSQFSLYFIPLHIEILITLSQTFPHEISSAVSWSFPSAFSAILTSMKLKGVLQAFLIELWYLSLKTLTTFLSYHFRDWPLLVNETRATPHHECCTSHIRVLLSLVPGGLISASNTVSSCDSRNINGFCL